MLSNARLQWAWRNTTENTRFSSLQEVDHGGTAAVSQTFLMLAR